MPYNEPRAAMMQILGLGLQLQGLGMQGCWVMAVEAAMMQMLGLGVQSQTCS